MGNNQSLSDHLRNRVFVDHNNQSNQAQLQTSQLYSGFHAQIRRGQNREEPVPISQSELVNVNDNFELQQRIQLRERDLEGHDVQFLQKELDNYMNQRISMRQMNENGILNNLSTIHGLYVAEMHQQLEQQQQYRHDDNTLTLAEKEK